MGQSDSLMLQQTLTVGGRLVRGLRPMLASNVRLYCDSLWAFNRSRAIPKVVSLTLQMHV